MTLTTLMVLMFLSAFLLVLGLWQLTQPKGANVAKRVKGMNGLPQPEEGRQQEGSTDLLRKTLRLFGGLRLFNRLGRGMEKQLEESDVPLTGGEFMALDLSSMVLTMLIVFSLTMSTLLALTIGAVSLFVPFFLVKRSRQKRLTSFNGQICDAITIMSNALRAGFSFMQSMDMVRKEMPDPISKEFNRTFREVNLGASTERALQNLSSRVNSDDLDLLITAVLIQRQVGGNLAEVLDNIADTIRERVRLQGEIRTLTAQGKLSGMIIGLLPVVLGLFMLAVNPTYVMELVIHPLGRLMLGMAVAGEIIGFMLIKRIVSIRV